MVLKNVIDISIRTSSSVSIGPQIGWLACCCGMLIGQIGKELGTKQTNKQTQQLLLQVSVDPPLGGGGNGR